MAMLKWTVVFSVDESWVADGFDLDDARAKNMLSSDLDYAYDWEIDAKVIKAPSIARIKKAQGFK